jgi:hypothetical protein
MTRSGSVKHRDRRDGTCLEGLPGDGLKRVLVTGSDEFWPGRGSTSGLGDDDRNRRPDLHLPACRPLNAAAQNRLVAGAALAMLGPGRGGVQWPPQRDTEGGS